MDERQLTYSNFEVPDPGRIEKVRKFVLKQFPSGAGEPVKLLEFGSCKNGLAFQLSKEAGYKCYGVDINLRDIPGVAVKQADANNGIPDFGVPRFDVIFAGEFIEHLYDENKFLKSCGEILADEGCLILTVPNMHFSLNRLLMPFGFMPFFSYAPEHYHMYSKKIIVEILNHAGFDVVGLKSSHVLFPARTPMLSLPWFIQKPLGGLFELLGDIFPTFGGHLILFCKAKKSGRV